MSCASSVPELILASGSPHRRALLERLGIPFRAIVPPVDEEDLKHTAPSRSPRDLAEFLADAKAEAVARDHPEAIVVGSDQLVAFDGAILGKPGSFEAACDQLARLAGTTHELVTALTVRHRDARHRHTNVTLMTMRPLDPEAIARVVRADASWDCAGAYKIESRGIALFERIETDDFTAIIGLPLIALVDVLRLCGLTLP